VGPDLEGSSGVEVESDGPTAGHVADQPFARAATVGPDRSRRV